MCNNILTKYKVPQKASNHLEYFSIFTYYPQTTFATNNYNVTNKHKNYSDCKKASSKTFTYLYRNI